MKLFVAIAFTLSLSTTPVFGQDTASLNVVGENKTAIIATEQQKNGGYDGAFNYSPAVRAGDYIYASGVVAGASGIKEPLNKEAFKASVRRALKRLEQTLKAGGAELNDVIKINTFHVFDSPHTTLSKHEQVLAVAEVKNEFIGEPHPAWTAVGTTALYPDKGLVEIEVVVYSPPKK
ncbi:Rid family hydrolase [Kordiimonas laminariae]|uniref:Rid family hydrolase n=1 Tax=Kordiimonas laminariae TaxID=2917717 RepID=UPI001FF427EF|nr:Rid family hydrolase [Kordiimonas laminariae]MCK0069948.1 Rid family hydrolase [Kordiimonas laminariae]